MATRRVPDIEILIHVSSLVLLVTNKLALTFELALSHDVGLVKKRNVNLFIVLHLQSQSMDSFILRAIRALVHGALLIVTMVTI